jgi:hypothetical protein
MIHERKKQIEKKSVAVRSERLKKTTSPMKRKEREVNASSTRRKTSARGVGAASSVTARSSPLAERSSRTARPSGRRVCSQGR